MPLVVITDMANINIYKLYNSNWAQICTVTATTAHSDYSIQLMTATTAAIIAAISCSNNRSVYSPHDTASITTL